MVPKVHISIVLDRSGSMESCRADAVGAVNSYLRQARDDAAMEARLSLVIFDSQSIDTIRDRVPVNSCPELTLEEYQPRAATPLLDAVGYSVGILDCLSDKDERRIMAIMTDGIENSSREYTHEKLRSVLDRKQKEEGWLILYLGAGHDSWTQAGQIGIAPTHAADFSKHAIEETANVLHSAGKRYAAAPPGQAVSLDSGCTAEERNRLSGRKGRMDGKDARPR